MMFDTLALARTLKSASFSTEQAEALADALNSAAVESIATKQDLSAVKTELKAEIFELRAELKADISELRSELKTEISELRSELKTEISELRVELKTEISEVKANVSDMKADLVRWISGALVAQTLALAGIVVALIKLVH